LNELKKSRASVSVLGRRGEAQWVHARACLQSGRHAEALDALRRVRRLRPASDQPLLALSEADALLFLHRPSEAVRVATRALGTHRLDDDVTARLRVVRGRGWWLGGRVAKGRAEVRAAATVAREPLTHARAAEALGRFAWKAHDHDAAQAHLETAQRIFAGCGFGVGLVQALGHHAGVLRDAGKLEDALGVLDRRLALAEELPRLDLRAQARTDRATLLSALGRWDEAGQELDLAAATFRDMDDDREVTVVGAARVVVDLARGELGRARSVLGKVRDLHQRRGQTRLLAEALLLISDVELAAGAALAADLAAAEALGHFQAVRDAEGECRGRVRRVHALLALDRQDDAKREARRAEKSAPPQRGDLRGLALVAAGRVLLREDRAAAAAVFAEALKAGAGRPPFEAAARLGAAVAAGGEDADAGISAAIAQLAAFGDRRLLAYGVTDARRVSGRRIGDPGPLLLSWPAASGSQTAPAGGASVSRALADAAEAVTHQTPLHLGWAAAMQVLHPILGFHRAVLALPENAWEVRVGAPVIELPGGDTALEMTSEGAPARLVDLLDPRWGDDPRRVLHSLRWAVVAPAGAAVLYAELPPGRDHHAQDALGILEAFGRLMGPRLPPRAIQVRREVHSPSIVGRSVALQGVLEQVERIADSQISVHIFGETGTGKELIAEAVHRASPRRNRRFESLNVAALPDELFESLVFGHGRGAFTGAIAEHDGHVAAAEGGTLFLDEVADLTPKAQAKLLRFLEKREYCRLGETQVRKADVRVITAANRPLDALRPDLVFRIRELLLALPPLRARGDDLLLLSRHFLEVEARKAHRAVPVLRPQAVRALQAHAWPGNVRELQGEMRCAIALAGGGPIGPEHLFVGRAVSSTPEVQTTLRHALSAFERDYITATLTAHGGNRSQAARALGISRQTLLTKTRDLGV
jgi:transcriptional regulator with AAA-type ATPase domain/tetratricopeptide (TPR) repeat protein